MMKERFCQITLLFSIGFEKPVQLVLPLRGSPNGQVILKPVKVVVSSVVFWTLVTPADCGHDAVPAPLVQLPAGALALGVPILCVRTPEEASASLLAMVLFWMVTFSESCSEIPAPSQPARLFTMMLFVMVALFQN